MGWDKTLLFKEPERVKKQTDKQKKVKKTNQAVLEYRSSSKTQGWLKYTTSLCSSNPPRPCHTRHILSFVICLQSCWPSSQIHNLPEDLRNPQPSQSCFNFKVTGSIYRKDSSLVQIQTVLCASFISTSFLMFLIFPSWPFGFLGVYYLNSTYLWISQISSCYWFLILLHCS